MSESSLASGLDLGIGYMIDAAGAMVAVASCFPDAGPLGKLPLSQAQFGHPLIDRSRDRSPVFRHPFLRAPPRRRD